jgi:asparagine synthase (glutamine-hydrolysing)
MRHVPVSLLALNGRRKHVLREAASPFIPEAARDRAKKPLMAPPLTRGGTNALNEAVQDILRGDAMKHVPFLNNAAILRLADRGKLTGSAAADPLMLMAASLSVLQERYSLA